MGFARFMATGAGRLARIVAGIVLIALGIWVVGGAAGWIIAAIGIVPILAGAANVCLVSPVIHAPFRGRDVR
ncbi:MAG: DUF2892 domain-containing protein [Thermomicrobiales bacterium]